MGFGTVLRCDKGTLAAVIAIVHRTIAAKLGWDSCT
jgi:hypothetical protein